MSFRIVMFDLTFFCLLFSILIFSSWKGNKLEKEAQVMQPFYQDKCDLTQVWNV